MAVPGRYADIEDFGSYWYDDPATRTNGEFDCVLKREGDRFDCYECKCFDRPMTLEECKKEKEQVLKIPGVNFSGIGFVCTGGFDFDNTEGFLLINGESLYDP